MADEEKKSTTDQAGSEQPTEDQQPQFVMTDDEGNEVTCTVLYMFHSDHNDKDYLVYTTGVVEDDAQEVSAVIYDPQELAAAVNGEDVEVTFKPLTTELEWALVADSMKQVIPDGVNVIASDVVSDDVLDPEVPGETE